MTHTNRTDLVVFDPAVLTALGDDAWRIVYDAKRRGLGTAVLGSADGAPMIDHTIDGEPDTLRRRLGASTEHQGDVVVVTRAGSRWAAATAVVTIEHDGGGVAALLARLAGVRPEPVETENELTLDDGWTVVERRFEPDRVVTTGSNFMTGNGYLGYRGTFPEWRADAFVGCAVTDTWDCADGKWSELTNVPNGLFVEWRADGEPLGLPAGRAQPEDDDYLRSIDVRYGVHDRVWSSGATTLRDMRFASMDELHLVAMRQEVTAPPGTRMEVTFGIDGRVWSLNGEHFDGMDGVVDDGLASAEVVTGESGVEIVVAQSHTMTGAEVHSTSTDCGRHVATRTCEVEVGATGRVQLDLFMAVATSNDLDASEDAARRVAREAATAGFIASLERHVRAWDAVWGRSDIVIEGDPVAQTVLRYNLFHNVIATPRHSDRLPIGARGLSCQAYQGAAFWDQELFNLPMFLFTEPRVARQLLTYRHRTIDGARRKARRLGYRGAYYAWISGKTGDELCPDFFFKDVLTGRPIRNHFNDWQMHISPDIAATVHRYVHTTGDYEFLTDHGAEMVFEIARFLESFVYFKVDKDRYETIRLLGPDEFHENVDNNAFTNHQVRRALDIAVETWEWLGEHHHDARDALARELGLTGRDVDAWREIRSKIYLPAPDPQTLLIEQFDGYFDLEDVTPDELRTRLQDPAEYWGWPNGVAVHTQVTKQADVVQLFVTQTGLFDTAVQAANFDYYLPRDSRKSSLSASAFAVVAARLGRTEHAYELFLTNATVDVFSTVSAAPGGTFIGGIRTAACGASWQVAVIGFGGVRVHDDRLELAPHLPAHWTRLAFDVVVRGHRVHVDITPDAITLVGHHGNRTPIDVEAIGTRVEVEPGERHVVAR